MRKPFPNASEIALEDIDFTRIVRPGDMVMWSQGVGEPTRLVERLMAQRHEIGGFTVFLGGSFTDTVRPEHGDAVSMLGLGAVGTNRALCDAGLMRVIPCPLSALPRYLASNRIKVDVVLMQFGPEGEAGLPTPGAVNAYAQYALAQARVAIAEINMAAPQSSGSIRGLDAFSSYVRTYSPLVELARPRPSETDMQVARQAAGLVRDGDIVQVGIGMVPNALLKALSDRRRLGFHAGIAGDALVPLIESGVVDNSTRTDGFRGRSVTGALAGTARLYDFASGNPDLVLAPVGLTHAPDALAGLENFVAINAAIEVDLGGQVNSEIAGRRYVGTVGGLPDFVRGALAAPGGRSLICLPARTARGQPRIVPRIDGAAVTLPRSDADIVVTEFGTADLRAQPLDERARRMVAIAHPADRDALEKSMRDGG